MSLSGNPVAPFPVGRQSPRQSERPAGFDKRSFGLTLKEITQAAEPSKTKVGQSPPPVSRDDESEAATEASLVIAVLGLQAPAELGQQQAPPPQAGNGKGADPEFNLQGLEDLLQPSLAGSLKDENQGSLVSGSADPAPIVQPVVPEAPPGQRAAGPPGEATLVPAIRFQAAKLDPGGGQMNGPPTGTDLGPEIGSITLVDATDGVKTESLSPGPGWQTQPLTLADLEVSPISPSLPSHDIAELNASGDPDPSGQGDTTTARENDPAELSSENANGQATDGQGDHASESSADRTQLDRLGIRIAGPELPNAGLPSDAVRVVRVEEARDTAPLRSAIVAHTVEAARGGNPSINLVLHPEHLGEVQVRVFLADGAVNAYLKVENPEVRQTLQTQIEALRMALVDQGIKVDKFEVNVSSQEERFGGEGGSSGGQTYWQSQSHAREEANWAMLAYSGTVSPDPKIVEQASTGSDEVLPDESSAWAANLLDVTA